MKPELDYQGLLDSLIFVESSNDPNAVSSKGAVGLTQIMPQYAHKLRTGVPSVFEIADEQGFQHGEETPEEAARLLKDPVISIELGDQLLQRLLQRERGEIDDALRAYNMGADELDDWERSGKDVSRLSQEAREYPEKIRDYYRELTGMDLPDRVAPVFENGIGFAPATTIRPRKRPEGLLSRIGE